MKRVILGGIFFTVSLWGVEWQNYGLEVMGTTNKENALVVFLKDNKGTTFSVENGEALPETTVVSLLQLKDMMVSWTRIVPDSLSFVYTGTGLEVLLVPKVVRYRGQDLVSYLPAGMRFSWKVGLTYDFRMLIGTNLVRIRGAYESEEELLARMNRAVQYPSLYMRSEDIDLLLQKVESIEERTVFLEAENAALKKLWLAYLNKNIFGQLRPISDAVIDRIVALKKTNPRMDRKEIYNQLRAENLRVSQKEVDLVLLVYFGQY
ncbi:hypothetical protein [Thermospira aquatica]|uniref:Uncharacterized protein n=1 Tax=Thermospira aquatica TaxID=2828656 RepID=A0AAX3BCE4_9SPIR|nr:hypothetical protein [Thermospira aquatica]URA09935.1 hypothetical protein KDW03_10710 [Thermospira aquatica]